jgi:ribosome-associated protein
LTNKSTTANRTLTAPRYNSSDLLDLIIDSIQDIKGKNVMKLDMSKLDDAPADYFVICSGDSTTQVKAISGNISRRVKEELSLAPAHVEGTNDARWCLVDYFDIVVHIFYPETREFYDIEDLWSDAEITSYEDVV